MSAVNAFEARLADEQPSVIGRAAGADSHHEAEADDRRAQERRSQTDAVSSDSPSQVTATVNFVTEQLQPRRVQHRSSSASSQTIMAEDARLPTSGVRCPTMSA